ncbi:endonuclease/exonuclease/phosphatase family protein [Virgisporangium aurantiacum]
MHKIRVMSYNIHSSRDDLRALGAVVRAEEPDLLLVQEAPRRFRWRGKNASLARRWGMLQAGVGLWALGNSAFTTLRVGVRETWDVQFPLTPGRHMRGAVFVRCTVGRSRFIAVGTHLSLDATERVSQAQLLKEHLAGLDEPYVVAGDLNEEPGGGGWRTLADGLVDAADAKECGDIFTYSCASPRRRIDGVFVDPRIDVLDYRLIDSDLAKAASDHFPLVVDLALPE